MILSMKKLPLSGQIIPEVPFELEDDSHNCWLTVYRCSNTMVENKKPVSPTALSGICIAQLARLANIPAGSIQTHAAVAHTGNVFPGETVYFSGRTGRLIKRGGVILLTMLFEIHNSRHEPVIRGRTSLLLPLEQGGG